MTQPKIQATTNTSKLENPQTNETVQEDINSELAKVTVKSKTKVQPVWEL